jgi:hypothetical protein
MIKWTKYHSDENPFNEDDLYLIQFYIRPIPYGPILPEIELAHYDEDSDTFYAPDSAFFDVPTDYTPVARQNVRFYAVVNEPIDHQLKIDFGGQEKA